MLTNAGREPGSGRPFDDKSVIVLKTKNKAVRTRRWWLRNSEYDRYPPQKAKAAPLTSFSMSASDLTFRSARIVWGEKKKGCVCVKCF